MIDVAFLMTEILVVLQYMNPVADLFPSYAQMVVFAFWLLFLSKNKVLFSKCIRISLISAAILFVTLIRCVIAGKMDLSYFSPMQIVIARYQFFVYPTMFTYIIHLDNKRKQKLFHLSVISMIATVILSLYYVFRVDPQAIRNTQGVSYFGVGDFQLMYAMALFCGPYFSYIRKRMSNKEKVKYHIVAFCLMVICIVLCNLVTAVVVLGLSIAISYFLSIKKSSFKVFLIVIGSAVISLKNVWADILCSIADKEIFYWSTNIRIVAIANLLSGTYSELSTLPVRVRLIKMSLDSFKRHPFFGINFSNHQSGVVGCHAQWADDLARFGIVGNLVIWLNYVSIARYTLKYSFNFEMKSSMIATWITFVIMGFLNPCLSGTILMVMFVVIPSMYLPQIGESTIESSYIKSI